MQPGQVIVSPGVVQGAPQMSSQMVYQPTPQGVPQMAYQQGPQGAPPTYTGKN